MFNKALARDGFMCMVTGMLDHSSVRHCQPLLRKAEREAERKDITTTEVQAAHILKESTMEDIDPEGGDEEGATTRRV